MLSTADLPVNMALNLMRFDVDIFTAENILFPAHEVQQTAIFLDLDEITSKCLCFQLSKTITVCLFCVIICH